MKFYMSGFGTFVARTGYFDITLDSSFNANPGGSDLVCLWESKRSICSMTGQTIRVYAP